MLSQNRLFIFEGSDGSGKSTAFTHTVEALQKEGYDVHTFREPDGEARQKLKNPNLTTEEQLVIFKESRTHLYNNTIKPLLANAKSNTIILIDRGWVSTVVYQLAPLYENKNNISLEALCDPLGETYKAFLDSVGVFNEETMGGVRPIVLFFNCLEETAVQRTAKQRTDAIAHLDREDMVRAHWKIYQKIYALFTNIPVYIAEEKHERPYVFNPMEWIPINTEQPIETVVQKVLKCIHKKIQHGA